MSLILGLIYLRLYCMRSLKEHGVLLIDAQNDKLRQLEKPLLKQIVTNHSKINQVSDKHKSKPLHRD